VTDASVTPSSIDPQTALKLRRAASCSFDANSALLTGSALFAEAAYGDLLAQRILRNVTTNAAFALGIGNAHSLSAASEMTMMARLCAAHRQPEDARRLAGALCFTADAVRYFGNDEAADTLHGETIAILERLAADGDEYCAVASEAIVQLYPAAGSIAAALMKEAR
jgi:hypothetical protein